MPDSGQATAGGVRYPENVPRPDPSTLTTDQLLREIAHLRELVEEKFTSVQGQFLAEKEARQDTLAAAQEAVAKSEIATEKSIDRIRDAIDAAAAAQAARIEDLKSRMDRGEGKGAGFGAAGALIAAIVGFVGTVVGIALALFAFGKS